MEADVLRLRVGALVDGTGAPAQSDQAILIEDGRIVDVGPDARVARPEHARHLDYPRPRPRCRASSMPTSTWSFRARTARCSTTCWPSPTTTWSCWARRRRSDSCARASRPSSTAARAATPAFRIRDVGESRPGPRAADPRQRPADHAHRRPLLVVGRRGRRRRRRSHGGGQAPRRGGRRRHQDDGHRRLHDHDDEPVGVGLSARVSSKPPSRRPTGAGATSPRTRTASRGCDWRPRPASTASSTRR